MIYDYRWRFFVLNLNNVIENDKLPRDSVFCKVIAFVLILKSSIIFRFYDRA